MLLSVCLSWLIMMTFSFLIVVGFPTTISTNVRRRTVTTIIYTNTSIPVAFHTLFDEGSVRLVGGESSFGGNVEIYHNGRWGSICDDEWDEHDGDVVCRSLGYSRGARRVTTNSFFGPGRPIIWMDDVYCTGNEASLTLCPFSGWKVHDCESNEVAGVVCETSPTSTTIRSVTQSDDVAQPTISYLTSSSSSTHHHRRAARTEDDNNIDNRNYDLRSSNISNREQLLFQWQRLPSSSISVNDQRFSYLTTRRTTTEPTRAYSNANSVINSMIDLQVSSSPSVVRRVPTLNHVTLPLSSKPTFRIDEVRLSGGRNPLEGLVEVNITSIGWIPVCGDGWSLPSATVVCRHRHNAFAHYALENTFPLPNDYVVDGYVDTISVTVARIECRGHERNLSDCHTILLSPRDRHQHKCKATAGVICTFDLPDLRPDPTELESSVYLEDKHMILLQCAAEENCLSSTAASIDKSNYGWFYETRRLLRFTAKIGNYGTADFRPNLSKASWIWHSCHRHYHSMEVFAHFDVLRPIDRTRMAEGHKASFCLEDNDCEPGILPKYKCADFGDQGISVGCKDIYLNNIDCQWIDITDLPSGQYIFKMTVNPEMKVAESSFENNSVLCFMDYDLMSIRMFNCTIGPI